MQARQVACVFGGSGFIGRYVVKRLAAAGYVVRVAVRDPERAAFLKPCGAVGQVVPLAAPIEDETAVAQALAGASVAINLVGILAERAVGDFSRVQAEGAIRVARLAAAAGVAQLVHVSAIGAAAESDALYAQSKAAGEAGVLAAFPSAVILRPSIVFGAEDQFFNRFAAMASLAPVMPVIAGSTRFQPVYVGDVADAVMAALHQPQAAGKIYELGGPEVLSFRELFARILHYTGRRRPLINVPSGLAELLTLVPFSGLTADQLRMLGRDNVADPARPGLAALGITTTPIGAIVPGYLARFRHGGLRPDYAKGPIRT